MYSLYRQAIYIDQVRSTRTRRRQSKRKWKKSWKQSDAEQCLRKAGNQWEESFELNLLKSKTIFQIHTSIEKCIQQKTRIYSYIK